MKLGSRPRKVVRMSAPLVKPEWRGIAEEEMTEYQCSWNDLISKSRMDHIVKARWSIWRRLSDERGATAYRMSKVFGVHHTTILNALGTLAGDKRARRDNTIPRPD